MATAKARGLEKIVPLFPKGSLFQNNNKYYYSSLTAYFPEQSG